MNLIEESQKRSSSEPMVFSKAVNNSVKNDTSPVFGMPALGFFDLDLKMILILILIAIVILTSMGINILYIMGYALQSGTQLFNPIFSSFFDLLGDFTGTGIKNVSHITATAATTGIDIVDGAVQDVGNLMIGDNTIGGRNRIHNLKDPNPDVPENSIQKSLVSAKTKWCLVGEYQNKRGCIDISESDKCMSGEVFPNEETCILGRPQFQNS